MLKKLLKREEGISLIWLALTLVVLLGMAGFGIDLGWIYLNTSRAQKAVDAAALAGVVNLPGFIALANDDAEDAARANGYDPGPPGPDQLTITPLADNKLHAELRTSIEPFFLKVLGFDHFNITREATSEYIKPVPLGNPNNCFGCPGVGDSWAAISSQFIHKEHGDPYSTQCVVPNGGGTACQSSNGDWNRGGAYSGYYYGIEVMTGSSGLTVDLYDPGFFPKNQDEGTGDFKIGGGPEPTTTYTLHAVDTTPLDPTDNPAIGGCSSTYPPGSGPRDDWDSLCSLSGSVTPGIYVLHVTTSGQGIASNHYSVRANSSITPRVFGINDMSIWSNDLVQNSQLYLAEIEEIHAGKKLELQFFDPGDANANSWMSVIAPNGNVPNCSWTVWNHNLTSQTKSPGSGPCTWQTTDTSDPDGDGDRRNYNSQWIVAVIDLPALEEDMCDGSDCFWKMELDLSDPTERTTWRARVIGNPVRLVPPETVP